MKKTIKSLLAIAVAAFAFTACSDVPEPYSFPSSNGSGQDGEETIGTFEAPLTVDEALAEFDKLADGGKTTIDAIIIGKVSRNVTSASNFASYKNINYYISVDGTQNGKEVEVYKGMGLNNAEFSAVTDIKQGDEVIVKGKLYKYKNNNTGAIIPEVENGYLLKHTPAGGSTSDETLGTLEAPLTIDQALAEFDNLADGGKTTADAIVTGVVSRNTTNAANFAQYKNINYYISVDGTENGKEIQVYKGMGLNNAEFSAVTDIKQGDQVVVRGKLYKYKNNNTGAITPEIENGYLLKYTAGTGGSDSETKAAPSGSGTSADPFNIAKAVEKCTEIGTTPSDEEFYVKGIAAAEATVTDATNKNITFDLTDDGYTQKFKAYRVIAADGKKLKVGYKIPKGATVIVRSKLVNYNEATPETAWSSNPAYNGAIISVNGQAPEVDDGTTGGETGGGTSGGGTTGIGSYDSPYSVASGISAQSSGTVSGVYIKGYIVGWVDGQVLSSGAHFDGSATSKTNCLIADSPSENNIENCMPVQLPNNAVRTGLNLQDNPQYYGKSVTLYGNLEKYFGTAGVKSVTYAESEGNTFGAKP